MEETPKIPMDIMFNDNHSTLWFKASEMQVSGPNDVIAKIGGV